MRNNRRGEKNVHRCLENGDMHENSCSGHFLYKNSDEKKGRKKRQIERKREMNQI